MRIGYNPMFFDIEQLSYIISSAFVKIYSVVILINIIKKGEYIKYIIKNNSQYLIFKVDGSSSLRSLHSGLRPSLRSTTLPSLIYSQISLKETI